MLIKATDILVNTEARIQIKSKWTLKEYCSMIKWDALQEGCISIPENLYILHYIKQSKKEK